ncbi:dihydrolipoyl dehydrogenase [Brevundimonas sp. 2R-24]|uniref:Dihydrolipoyl dehydrogenase n=1 Tax=Peiella sedimenti TaxID=3061083 RepID=A0ABT8SL38_9CAUL|nr:dihydrolipoyl dehydrogenase [Caulobacteraceae bacterium XZ-24]
MADQQTYDVVIIGGGPGGYNAAIRAGQLGLKAACVEMRGTLGGTCLNVGCMPSKALLHASELYEAAGGEFAKIGIEVAPSLNLSQMMAAKAESVGALTKGIEFLFKKNKVDWVRGRGRIAGPGKVVVETPEGQTELSTRNIVIATGSEPTPLPGVEFVEGKVVDSTGALDLQAVPKTLAVVGAGIIGLELGSVWRRLGAQVTVIEFLDRITPGMDAEVAKTFQRSLTKQGMTFKLGTKVTAAKADKDGVTLTLEPAKGEGAAETLQADVVLVAIGRRPYTAGLGLETVGVTPDQRGFIANDHFKTSAEGVWVIGDVTYGPMLAHKAEEDAVACIELIAGKAGHVDYDLVPSVVYTAPEVAWVGKTEEELKAAGVEYRVGKFPFVANSRAKINHETDGFVKFLADAKTDRVLGVHVMGPQAGEMIGEACVLMAFSGASEDLARICHPHPTRSEALRQAAMGVEGWTMQA